MGCQPPYARQKDTFHGIGVSLTAAQDIRVFLSATYQVRNHMVYITEDKELQSLQRGRLPLSCVYLSIVLTW